jgi:hypothetical protein
LGSRAGGGETVARVGEPPASDQRRLFTTLRNGVKATRNVVIKL